MKVSVMWRGNKYTIEIDPNSNLKDLGYELRNLTGVTAETLRLIVPRLNEKGSNLLLPFSDEHSFSSLHESSITEGKTIRMMGVTEEEFNGVQKDAMPDMRILGFEDEERRLRLKKFSSTSIKLPQGPYIFCAFRTLQLPGIELNPPPADALKRMHMLASDPGIIAIMNKHRWRVGIMTELAPVGYVGVSPKCLLGFNKNQGEEISLRLRTDDLKGFRKYQSIKKTLLHELAHMVYTEHDEKFYALDSQLNKEAESLDWTKSRGHTLNGAKVTKDIDDEEDLFDEIGDENFSQRLGGDQYDDLGNARESSVAAAYRRLSHTSASKLREEPDPDDSVDVGDESKQPIPPEAHSDSRSQFEPDPDDAIEDASTPEHHSGSLEPDPDDVEARTSIGEVENMEISNDTVMSDGNLTRPPGETNAEETIIEVDEPDLDDMEIQRIQDSVTIVSNRLTKAINAMKTGFNSGEATNVLQMLLKIVRNIIEQPNEMKFKRLRKGNPAIKRKILNFPAAVEILSVVGFVEEMVSEGTGAPEPYLVLKRNDPGLLWIAKSMIESHTTGS
ncbi:WLM [Raphanus sativus]|uniref:DNA-dependent metalloprotease WSS1 homolog 2 isoform X1 n=2 Tax=Raphanus sativus TaxID=3726 RepID=A0A6J0LEQ8_RAPSA|nr:DNA-dependent metalloprotease WSS1 homolog 2 isoform X1 [Raphanus sativus]XP_018458126.1 DNA-dependent metalloprotease WSS1 homolog 2 isoform X1 [Raphanus sativus]KAJ4902136.1 WLM [Raphanus sativus]